MTQESESTDRNEQAMIVLEKTIGNRIGLHLRAAGEFVKVASQFQSEITVYNGARSANGKSILSLAGLAAGYGTPLRIEIDGPDECDARDAIEALIDANFHEE